MLELDSTLTDRYQTTVPGAIRKALGLGKRDKIRFSIQPDGAVLLRRSSTKEHSDPVLGRFLNFLAQDIKKHPRNVRPVEKRWLTHIRSLIRNVKVDLDTPLSQDNE
jgi:antitoxin PrlF